MDPVERAAQEVSAWIAVKQIEVADLRKLIEEGIEAFRLTREYVFGAEADEAMPAVPGWAWFDWCEKARRAVAP
jgi:predicted transcriptional regulator